MRIVVDTNIIFSALLNTKGTIGDLLLHSSGVLQFYSCHYLRHEIKRHWVRLLKISRLTDADLQAAYERVLTTTHFVDEELAPPATWRRAEELVIAIDRHDVAFVVLADYLDGILWTGDKPLYEGLRHLGFQQVCNTSDLVALRTRLLRQ